MRLGRLVFLLVIFVLSAVSAFSADVPQYVDINLTETVDRNQSFNENFNDGESVQSYTITGDVNITNVGPNTIFDVSVVFQNTANLQNQSGAGTGPNARTNETYFLWYAGRNGTELNGTPPQPITLHIPELRSGDSASFNYSVSAALTEPLNITTDYQLPANDYYYNKVLSGGNFTIKQNISNTLGVGANITDINVTMRSMAIRWGNTSLSTNFSLVSVNQSGDYLNVTQYDNRSWSWTPGGGNLTSGESYEIVFLVQAPFQVPSTGSYLAVQENFSYASETTASNLSVQSVLARAKVNMSFTKRISQPATNLRDLNATWEVISEVDVPVNVSYQLTGITLWVSPGVNPNIYGNDSIGGGRLLQNVSVNTEINLTLPYTSSAWYFNYSDGTSGTPPPIVWMRPQYHIRNDYGQILNYTLTRNGTDVYQKFIYVISGYWLEIDKNITNTGPDNYSINISVLNRGNGNTPENLTVSVYDIIPSGFSNVSRIYPQPNVESAVTGIYNGTALQWDIPWRVPYNSSLLAFGDVNGHDRWTAGYNVTGTGDYNVLDLYIVGLDPRRVDGAFSSPLISIIGGFQSFSREVLYFSIVLFLIVLNTTNLVISNKIHQKLGSGGSDDLEQLHADIRELKQKMKKK